MERVLSVSVNAEVDKFNIKLNHFGGLDENKLNIIKQFFNSLLRIYDETNEWEEFVVHQQPIFEICNIPLIEYRLQTKGGKTNLAREYSHLTFIN